MTVTFEELTDAKEYAKLKAEEGYNPNVSQDRNGKYSVSLLSSKQVKREGNLEEVLKERKQLPKGIGTGFVGTVKKGFDNIAESLAHSEDSRRPRISQMPGRHTPIARVPNTANPISGKNAGIRRQRISNVPR